MSGFVLRDRCVRCFGCIETGEYIFSFIINIIISISIVRIRISYRIFFIFLFSFVFGENNDRNHILSQEIVAGKHLYTASAKGLVEVVDISGDDPQIVAENDMQEEMLSSPAIANGAIYLRGVSHLWKIE